VIYSLDTNFYLLKLIHGFIYKTICSSKRLNKLLKLSTLFVCKGGVGEFMKRRAIFCFWSEKNKVGTFLPSNKPPSLSFEVIVTVHSFESIIYTFWASPKDLALGTESWFDLIFGARKNQSCQQKKSAKTIQTIISHVYIPSLWTNSRINVVYPFKPCSNTVYTTFLTKTQFFSINYLLDWIAVYCTIPQFTLFKYPIIPFN
jgi:hypothetical protein